MSKCEWAVMTMMMVFPAGYCLAGGLRDIAPDTERSLKAPPEIYVTRLSERVLQLRVRGPLGTNIVVVATQKGLVVIDTYTAPFIFEQVSRLVEQEFGRKDFAYVINSHEDVDHAGGAGFFRDIIMVGHETLFKALRDRHSNRRQWQSWYRGRIGGWIKGREETLASLDGGSAEARELTADIGLLRKVDKDCENGFSVMPDNPRAVISFRESLVLELGDITIELYACKAGHTPSDILIYIPQEKFLFTGDAAQRYIQKNVDIERWLEQLEQFARPDMETRVILDGHNAQPYTKGDLKVLRDYVKATWESVQQALQRGAFLDQIKSKYSIDNEMSRFRSMVGTPFAETVEQLRKSHEYNIELIAGKVKGN